MLKAKNDDASSPDSTSSKFTNAAVPKPKVDTKRKASNGSSQAVKKRKIKNGDVAVIEIDSEEEGLPSRVNGAGKSKSKVDGMLVSDDGKDGHEMVKEEPFTSDEFLSDSGLPPIRYNSWGLHYALTVFALKTYFVLFLPMRRSTDFKFV